ncbi:hypothetical protein GWK36_08870 [Caldichromatium japonicum]|uniref:Large ribosomal RNA subunit accumulation protein YceD n=1 Tax=Caldichromatium japonicum TaxID=2699430 RepID=A0A6G7VE57_9GAMM|nr:YceD family protein [Caldichromatium japonicum]QIK38077.1 hypothetical protein GWK36_08870 [Caldichromatium japonicum]
MLTNFPDFIDPWRAADHCLALAGELPTRRLPRLIEFGLAAEDAGEALQYRLEFGCDEAGQAYLGGMLRMRLCLVCQRCLRELWLDLEAPLGLVLVRSESAALEVQSQHEVFVVQDILDLRTLIEDEILLTIPSFPRHADGECQAPGPQTNAAPWGGRPENPFAVLARLKGR